MSNAQKTTTGKTHAPASKKPAATLGRAALLRAAGGKPFAKDSEPKGFRQVVKVGEAVVTFKKGASRTIVEPKGPVKLGTLGRQADR